MIERGRGESDREREEKMIERRGKSDRRKGV